MREHNIVCDNCRVEINHGRHFIGVVTYYQDGFDIKQIFPGDDAHFCDKQCLVTYLIKPKMPYASCCATHAGGYNECKD